MYLWKYHLSFRRIENLTFVTLADVMEENRPSFLVICVLTRGDGQELGQVRATPTCISRSRINALFEEAGESARQKSFT